MLIQAAASIVEDPGIILAALIDRLNLTSWATMSVEESRLPEETFELADEFLLLVIAILTERIFTDVSEVKYLRSLFFLMQFTLFCNVFQWLENICRNESCKICKIFQIF